MKSPGVEKNNLFIEMKLIVISEVSVMIKQKRISKEEIYKF